MKDSNKSIFLVVLFSSILFVTLFVSAGTGIINYFNTSIIPTCNPSGGCVNNTNPAVGATILYSVNWSASTDVLDSWCFSFNQSGSFVNDTGNPCTGDATFWKNRLSASAGDLQNGSTITGSVTDLLSNDNSFWNISSGAQTFVEQIKGTDSPVLGWVGNFTENTKPGNSTCAGGTCTKLLAAQNTSLGNFGTNAVISGGSNSLDAQLAVNITFPSTVANTNLNWINATMKGNVTGTSEVGVFAVWNFTSEAFVNIGGNQSTAGALANQTFNMSGNNLTNFVIGSPAHLIMVDYSSGANTGNRYVDYQEVNYNYSNYYTSVNLTSNASTFPQSQIAAFNATASFAFNVTDTTTWNFEIYNIGTNTWEAGTTGTLSTSKTTQSIYKSSSISNYVNSTGHLKVRIRVNDDTNPHLLAIDSFNVVYYPTWGWANKTYTIVSGDAGDDISALFYANSTVNNWNSTNWINISVKPVGKTLINITNPITMTDQLSRIGFFNQKTTVPFTTTANLIKTSSFFKSLTAANTLSNAISKIGNLFRNPLGSFSLSNAIKQTSISIKSALASLTDTSSISRIFYGLRNPTAALTINLNTIRNAFFTRLSTVAETISNTVSKIFVSVKLLTQSLTENNLLNSFAVRVKLLTQSLTGNLITTANSLFVRLSTIQLTISNSGFGNVVLRVTKIVSTLALGISNSLQSTLFAVRNISQTFTENVSLNSAAKFLKSISQSVTSNLGLIRVETFIKQLSQSLTENSVIAKLSGVIRNISQAISGNLSLTNASSFIRNLSQGITDNSLTQRISYLGKIISQLLTENNLIVSIRGFFRLSLQQFTDNTALATLSGVLKTISQSFGINNTLSEASARVKLLVQAITSNFSLTSISNFIRNITQSFSSSNIASFMSTKLRIVSQAITENLAITKLNGALKQVAQSFSILTSLIEKSNYLRNFGQAISESQIGITMSKLAKLITQQLTENSIVSGMSSFGRLLSQPFAGNTGLAKLFGNIRIGSVGLTVNAGINTITNFFRNITLNISTSLLTNRISAFAIKITQSFNLNFIISGAGAKVNQIAVSLEFTLSQSLSRMYVFSIAVTSPLQILLNLFSNFIAGQQTSPPGPSPLGTIAGTSYTVPITPPPQGQEVDFVSWNVLKEVSPNNAAVTGIVIKNTLNVSLTNVHVKISGIPQDWVSVYPESLDLNSSEEKSFNLAFSVPNNTEPGDYRVDIKLENQVTLSDNFLILRVNPAAGFDRPVLYRNVQIDRSQNKTDIQILVDNPSQNNYSSIEVVEDIPKTIANSSDEIQFGTTPGVILQKDPQVQWNLLNFSAGESRNISYSVNKILDDFAAYISNPLEQANFIKDAIPRGIRITKFYQPDLSPGESSTLEFEVQNLEKDNYNFTVGLSAPPGWNVSPNTTYVEIASGKSTRVKFDIGVPSDAKVGTYLLDLDFKWGSSETIKEFSASVGAMSTAKLMTILGFMSVIVIGVVAYFVLIKKVALPRVVIRYKRLGKPRPKPSVKNPKTYFRQKFDDLIFEINVRIRLLMLKKKKHKKDYKLNFYLNA